MRAIGKFLIMVGLIVAGLAAIAVFVRISESFSSQSGDVANTATVASEPATQMPDSEAQIVEIASKYRGLYDAVDSENEVKRTMIYDQRGKELCDALSESGFGIHNWTGRISSMTTSSDGSVDVEIGISDHASIGNKNTIPDESKLFVVLANMTIGEPVVFSGEPIQAYRGCMGDGSVTEEGSMDDPEFNAIITDIHKAN